MNKPSGRVKGYLGTAAERIAARTVVSELTGCAIWTGSGSTQHGAYPMLMDDNGQLRYAHHVQYELIHGPIPAGMEIDHGCNNSKCLAHLVCLTPEEHDARHQADRQRKYAAASGQVWSMVVAGYGRRAVKAATRVPLYLIDAVAKQVHAQLPGQMLLLEAA